MSNKASDHLFELISSLSGSEKRYFKLYSDRHHTKSVKVYARLFDEIDKQEVYDEEALLQKLEGLAITKHFPIAKNRLYHQVLKSLDSFYAMQTVESELHQYLHYSEILFEKALYLQCSRILNTAHKTALKHEKWAILIQVLNRQKRLAELNNYEKASAAGIKQLYEVEKVSLNHLKLEGDLWHAKSLLFRKLFTKGKARGKDTLKTFETELNSIDSILQNESASVEARYLRNHAKSAYYFAVADYAKSRDALIANANLLEENLHAIKDDASIMISVLTNLIYVCAKLNQFDDVEKYLSKSRNLPSKIKQRLTPHHSLKIFINTYSLELEICRISPNLDRIEGIIRETISGLNKWESKLSEVRKASFYHSISSLYFIQGDFKSALKWNNELLNSIKINETEDQYLFAHMFHLLIHVELQNYGIITNTLSRIERQLQNRKKRFKFERIFSSFMKAVSNPSDPESTEIAYQVFAADLEIISTNKFENQVFEYFDFLAWAQAKINKEPLHLVLTRIAPYKDVL